MTCQHCEPEKIKACRATIKNARNTALGCLVGLGLAIHLESWSLGVPVTILLLASAVAAVATIAEVR